jgi:hypothetical protein
MYLWPPATLETEAGLLEPRSSKTSLDTILGSIMRPCLYKKIKIRNKYKK